MAVVRDRRTGGVARRLAALGVVVLCCVTTSCGAEEKFFPVSGKVTLDGEALTLGTVSLRPDASRGNTSMHHPTGAIDAQGNYEVITVGRKGAPPGWYKVLVLADANSRKDAPADRPAHRPATPKWMTNVMYTDVNTTDLFIEVVEKPAPGAYNLTVGK